MAKEKKISFSYSLYKKSKEQFNEKNERMHPIYMKVIFNQKSTRFPLYVQDVNDPEGKKKYFYASDREFEDFKNEINDLSFKWVENIIEEIVRYEYEKFGEKYSVIGILDRFIKYMRPLLSITEDYYRASVLNKIGDEMTHNEFLRIEKEAKSIVDSSKEDIHPVIVELSTFLKEFKSENKKARLFEIKPIIFPFLEVYFFDDCESYKEYTGYKKLRLYDLVTKSKKMNDFKSFIKSKERKRFIESSIRYSEFFKSLDELVDFAEINSSFEKTISSLGLAVQSSEVYKSINSDI